MVSRSAEMQSHPINAGIPAGHIQHPKNVDVLEMVEAILKGVVPFP
jgi:hypothetical protein